MPFTYVIYPDKRLVVSTASGRVSFEEIKTHQDRLLGDPNFNPEFDQLLDARKATHLDLSIAEAQVVASRKLFSAKSKRAWVSSQPAIYGMGRLITAYHEMSDAASQVHVFYDLASALEWLSLESLPEQLA